MALFRRLAALGAAAEAARRYAQKNPDKVRGMADKAARFADERTKGKYHDHIETAKRKVTDVVGAQGRGFPPAGGPGYGNPPAGRGGSTPPTPYPRG